jgi:hypothetical protein
MYLDHLPQPASRTCVDQAFVTPEMTHIAVTLQRDSGNSIYERRDDCRTLLAGAGPWAAVRRSEATLMSRSLRYGHF